MTIEAVVTPAAFEVVHVVAAVQPVVAVVALQVVNVGGANDVLGLVLGVVFVDEGQGVDAYPFVRQVRG